jgi:hypothetical protein
MNAYDATPTGWSIRNISSSLPMCWVSTVIFQDRRSAHLLQASSVAFGLVLRDGALKIGLGRLHTAEL